MCDNAAVLTGPPVYYHDIYSGFLFYFLLKIIEAILVSKFMLVHICLHICLLAVAVSYIYLIICALSFFALYLFLFICLFLSACMCVFIFIFLMLRLSFWIVCHIILCCKLDEFRVSRHRNMSLFEYKRTYTNHFQHDPIYTWPFLYLVSGLYPRKISSACICPEIR